MASHPRFFAPPFLAAALAALAAPSARAGVYVYGCVLDARQEVPANASTAQGAGRFIIDTNTNTVSYRITFAGLSSGETGAHVHGSSTSSPGNNAAALETLPPGNPKVGVWNYSEPEEALILGGLCYANIHTSLNGGGEIRGQIVPFNALLDAAQAVPTNASTGSGWATLTIDTVAKSLKYYIAYAGLTGPVTGAHFHGNALPGTIASVKVAIPVSASPMAGTVSYAPADEGALRSGRWYVNLHTGANPGGEIRGQVIPTVVPLAEDEAISIQVPAPASSGYALVCVDTLANTLGYDVHLLALSGRETLTHIHGFAVRSVEAPVLATLAVGPRKIGIWNYGAANESDVLNGYAYFNAHTPANSTGEIRGQIDLLPGADPRLAVPPAASAMSSALHAAPNPFGTRTRISFQLVRSGSIALAIFDVNGRIVRSMPATPCAPGPHSFEWDGLDDAGIATAPGVYFALVRTPEGRRGTRIARLN